jgi:hypothetical protein
MDGLSPATTQLTRYFASDPQKSVAGIRAAYYPSLQPSPLRLDRSVVTLG